MMKEMTLQEALNRTGAEFVHVNFNQVTDLIGEEAAEELYVAKTGMSEKRPLGRNTAVKAQHRVIATDLARFDRKELLKAISEASQKEQEEVEPAQVPPDDSEESAGFSGRSSF